MTSTRAPARVASRAAAEPAAPKPTTTTSNSSSQLLAVGRARQALAGCGFVDLLDGCALFGRDSGNRLVDLLTAESGSRMAFASARLTVLPFLFFNLRYHYTFELREEFQDLTGDGLEQRTRLYHASHGWLADLELGWEF